VPYIILYTTIVFGFRYLLQQIAKDTLSAYYAALKESIVCAQLTDTDNTVLERSNRYRDLLSQSQNQLYLEGYLSVKEVYYKEVNVLETWTDYLLRVEDVKNQLAQHFLNDVKHDTLWCKEHLFRQRIH
jgi:hypothetical protein